MTIQTKVIIAVGAILTSFAFGRYSAKVTQKPDVVRSVETKVDTQVKSDKDLHKETVVTQVKAKDGSETTTTVIKEDTITLVDKTQKAVTNTQTTVTHASQSKTNISILAVTDISNLNKLSYGLSVDHSIVGPLTGRVFGLSNGVVGIGIGLDF